MPSHLCALFDTVQWTVTARHRSVLPLLLYKHLIPWLQHSILAFQLLLPHPFNHKCDQKEYVCNFYSETGAFVNSCWLCFSWGTHFSYCVSVAFACICTAHLLAFECVYVCLFECFGVYVCVCVYLCVHLVLVGQNELRNTEMLSAACAVGVGCCFAAPIGGKKTNLCALTECQPIMFGCYGI